MSSNQLSYTPTPGGGAYRVCMWFSINREEHLAASDITQKFDIPKSSICGILERAIGTGLLMIVRDHGTYYAAGPRLHEFVAAQAAAVTPLALPAINGAHKPPRAARRGPVGNHLPPLDPATIVVQSDMQPPANWANKRGQGKYVEAFDKLDRAGLYFRLPIQYRSAIVKAAQVYCRQRRDGQKLVVRTIDATTCGVWRTE